MAPNSYLHIARVQKFKDGFHWRIAVPAADADQFGYSLWAPSVLISLRLHSRVHGTDSINNGSIDALATIFF
ncbi:hypothetical protein K449DRAFT_382262 [Hypoxylon sp. EC38]|nr:hypothetical protein K449DRAFT_382262 [Hypoxylon sp. EC38]